MEKSWDVTPVTDTHTDTHSKEEQYSAEAESAIVYCYEEKQIAWKQWKYTIEQQVHTHALLVVKNMEVKKNNMEDEMMSDKQRKTSGDFVVGEIPVVVPTIL